MPSIRYFSSSKFVIGVDNALRSPHPCVRASRPSVVATLGRAGARSPAPERAKRRTLAAFEADRRRHQRASFVLCHRRSRSAREATSTASRHFAEQKPKKKCEKVRSSGSDRVHSRSILGLRASCCLWGTARTGEKKKRAGRCACAVCCDSACLDDPCRDRLAFLRRLAPPLLVL